jgi:hypothetical protein
VFSLVPARYRLSKVAKRRQDRLRGRKAVPVRPDQRPADRPMLFRNIWHRASISGDMPETNDQELPQSSTRRADELETSRILLSPTPKIWPTARNWAQIRSLARNVALRREEEARGVVVRQVVQLDAALTKISCLNSELPHAKQCHWPLCRRSPNRRMPSHGRPVRPFSPASLGPCREQCQPSGLVTIPLPARYRSKA